MSVWRVVMKATDHWVDYDFEYCRVTSDGALQLWNETGFWFWKRRTSGVTIANGEWVSVTSMELP